MDSTSEKPSAEPNPRGTAPELTRAPAPALPKGGGAIRAIGEKFSTNPVTGTGSLTVPLPVSPARSGFHPELTLSYDSGAGNGPFGLGWHLSIPAITRKTDKRLPEYLDAEDSDVFLLSGSEDLVPVLDDDGKRVSFTRDGEQIDRYRPRIEGLFARIERRRDLATGRVYWMSITPGNVKNVYGRSQPAAPAAEARITHPDDDPAGQPRVFSWLLERSEDALGNVIVYEYVAEDLVGVAATPGETHRLDGRARISNRYLKRVRYGNTVEGNEATCMFEVVLDYGEHDEAVPRPEPAAGASWMVRSDPFSSYRAGFEVRTYRLCRRALLFHRFPELGAEPCLVRSLSLTYATEERSSLTRLESARLSGHLRAVDATTYSTQSFPPLTLGYTPVELHTEVRDVDPTNLGDLLTGVDGATHRWVDLDGEGIPGLLSELGGALYYRRNLGGAALESPRTLLTRPQQTALAAGAQQLMDLGGDGRLDLVDLGPALAGFHERIPPGDPELDRDTDPAASSDGGWAPFQPFASHPAIDWKDPNVLFLDLDGDGLDDVVISGDELFTWYPSQGKEGFGPPRTFPRPRDEEKGPAVVFSDRTRALVTADLSGDGLRDLVRIGNGGICYWPNLGHGRFGAQVIMSGAPVFDHPDQFDARRVLLADIDGTGTTDLLYVKRDGVQMWFNQAGNGWSPPEEITDLPVDSASHITAVDLLGTGTACLVWSTPLPGPDGPRLRYVDLLDSAKPHLLAQIDNGLGLTTRLEYRPSTYFYLADRAAGISWASRLAFPVHVVSRVETYDSIRRVRFVSEYLYRDGYFDGHEREFRGFGYVEQRDTESDPALSGIGLFADRPPPVNGEYPQPPVVTMSWFHTGAWPPLPLPDGPPMAFPPVELTADALRDAHRALKGALLRQEIRCDDGSPLQDLPYAISAKSYEVRLVQPAQVSAPAVFVSLPREAIDYHTERNPEDPRIQHSFTIHVDDVGHTCRTVALAYPRRPGAANIQPEQQKLLATLSVSDFANETERDEWYRHGVPLGTSTFELIGLDHPGTEPLLDFHTVKSAADNAGAIGYDETPGASPFEKRLVERTLTRYFDTESPPNPLSWNQIDARALPYESYGLAFTQSLLASLYGDRVTGDILLEGGYVLLDTPSTDPLDWWVPSGRAQPSGPFFLATEFHDPWANVTTVTYDQYWLLVAKVEDPVENLVQVDNDYRTLGPRRITDANDNRASAEVDELGRVIATRIMGKEGSTDGDATGSPTATVAYGFHDPLLGNPSWAHTAARETHGDDSTLWQHSYCHFDGTGREVMKKLQAEAGKVLRRAADGSIEEVDVEDRWVGSGRTVFDNKGQPIKQFEPFFSSTPDYETDEDLAIVGVTPILHYDPVGRLILTEFPDGSTSRVSIDPWEQETWDRNDTVLDPGNRWYEEHGTERVGELTVKHARTSLTTVFDVLGRTVLTQVDDADVEKYEIRATLDIEGNPLVVKDPLDRDALVREFNIQGHPCHSLSIDAGESWIVVNVAGHTLRTWNNEYSTRNRYDAKQRPIELWVRDALGQERMALGTDYGEDAPDPKNANLRGKAHRHRDGAGLFTIEGYDFKGNLLRSSRRLAVDYAAPLNWAAPSEPALEPDPPFTQATAYDALNRVTGETTPDGTETRRTYNRAGLLDRIDVRLHETEDWTSFIRNIDYNARGQRLAVTYGRGRYEDKTDAATTVYDYDELTFRLRALTTKRSGGAVLQALSYVHDPIGNVVEIDDAAQQEIIFAGKVAPTACLYEYRAIYRLASATGRENASGIADLQRCLADAPLRPLPHPNDGRAVRPYRQQYTYDRVGNIVQLEHTAIGDTAASWTRTYDVIPGTNRLAATHFGGDQTIDVGHYVHDPRGNMISMPHLPTVEWDFRNRMSRAVRADGAPIHFVYDSSGHRVRKVYEHGGYIDETVYLGSYELYRRRRASGDAILLERQTLHLTDGSRRIALIETKTLDAGVSALTPTPRIRFQLDNHLGSSHLEIDPWGQVISYEEYHPYGTTSYRATPGDVDVSAKRYRYTGKERDEETGLSYHGARYYVPWLGRWTAADPTGLKGGVNLFEYAYSSPITLHDPSGHQGIPHYGLSSDVLEQWDREKLDQAKADYEAELQREIAQQEQPVPVLAAMFPSMAAGGAVRPSRPSDPAPLKHYRDLTGAGGLHSQYTTAGLAAAAPPAVTAVGIGLYYQPRLTMMALGRLKKRAPEIAEYLHIGLTPQHMTLLGLITVAQIGLGIASTAANLDVGGMFAQSPGDLSGIEGDIGWASTSPHLVNRARDMAGVANEEWSKFHTMLEIDPRLTLGERLYHFSGRGPWAVPIVVGRSYEEWLAMTRDWQSLAGEHLGGANQPDFVNMLRNRRFFTEVTTFKAAERHWTRIYYNQQTPSVHIYTPSVNPGKYSLKTNF